jgi:hypothetical protein
VSANHESDKIARRHSTPRKKAADEGDELTRRRRKPRPVRRSPRAPGRTDKSTAKSRTRSSHLPGDANETTPLRVVRSYDPVSDLQARLSCIYALLSVPPLEPPEDRTEP